MIEMSPALLAAGGIVVAALLTLFGVLAGLFVGERRFRTEQKKVDALLPGQIAASNADIEQKRAETVDSQNRTIAAQNGTIAGMVGQISDQNTKLFGFQNTIADQNLVISDLQLKSVKQDSVIEGLTAENAELKQKIIDYPARVVQLEEIIEQLRNEIRGLQGTASHNAEARLLGEQNMQTALAAAPTDAARQKKGVGAVVPADPAAPLNPAEVAIAAVIVAQEDVAKKLDSS